MFRRIKDVVDLYYLSKVFEFNETDILQRLKDSGRQLGSFDSFLYRSEELAHSYEKFRFTGAVDKPPFEEVYHSVMKYISAVLPSNGNQVKLR